MRKIYLFRLWTSALIVILALFAGCSSKRERTEQLAQDEPSVEEAANAYELQRAEEQPRKTSGEVIIVQASHPMLPFGIADRVLPEDFEIGPLQDTLDARDAAVLERLAVFAEKLLKSEIHADSFDEDKRMLLRNSLQYYVERQMVPEVIRFGIIQYDAMGNGYLALRLLTDKGRSTGEIFMGRRDDGWYITDLQLDLRTLTTEYPLREGKYVPSRYRSVLRLF